MFKKKPVAYIAAYGSLVDEKSRKSTIGKTIGRVKLGFIDGMERTWLAGERNNPNNRKFWIDKHHGTTSFSTFEFCPVFKPCYLDVQVNRKESLVVALIPVNESQIEALDDREEYYDRVDVTKQVGEWNSDIPVYIYMGKPEARARALDNEALIPVPYYNLCSEAAKRMSIAMSMNFFRHTESIASQKFINVALGDGITY